FIHGTGEILGLDGLCLNINNPICAPASSPVTSSFNTICAWTTGDVLYEDHFHRTGSRAMKIQVSSPGQTAYVTGDFHPYGGTASTPFQFVNLDCINGKSKACAGNTLPCCEDIFQGAGTCLTNTTRVAVGTYAIP